MGTGSFRGHGSPNKKDSIHTFRKGLWYKCPWERQTYQTHWGMTESPEKSQKALQCVCWAWGITISCWLESRRKTPSWDANPQNPLMAETRTGSLSQMLQAFGPHTLIKGILVLSSNILKLVVNSTQVKQQKSRKRCLLGSIHYREQTGSRYLFLEVKIIHFSCHRRNSDLSSPRDDVGNRGLAGWLTGHLLPSLGPWVQSPGPTYVQWYVCPPTYTLINKRKNKK